MAQLIDLITHKLVTTKSNAKGAETCLRRLYVGHPLCAAWPDGPPLYYVQCSVNNETYRDYWLSREEYESDDGSKALPYRIYV